MSSIHQDSTEAFPTCYRWNDETINQLGEWEKINLQLVWIILGIFKSHQQVEEFFCVCLIVTWISLGLGFMVGQNEIFASAHLVLWKWDFFFYYKTINQESNWRSNQARNVHWILWIQHLGLWLILRVIIYYYYYYSFDFWKSLNSRWCAQMSCPEDQQMFTFGNRTQAVASLCSS